MKKIIMILCICLVIGADIKAQKEQNMKELPVFGLPTYVPAGRTLTREAILEPGHIPDSAGFMPAGDITVANWKTTWAKKSRVGWSFTITINKNAALGKRQMIIFTQDGQTKPKEIEVVTHIPEISDLKIISKSPDPAKLQFSFKVSDAYADLGDLKDSPVYVTLSNGQIIMQTCYPINVIKLNNQTSIVEVAMKLENDHFVSGSSCDLIFSIYDKNNYNSSFKQKIDF